MSDISPSGDSGAPLEVAPDTPGETLRPAPDVPGAVLRPGQPAAAAPVAGAGEVVLKTPWPLGSFDSGIEGAPLIVQAGTAVEAGLAEQIKAVAERCGLTLEQE